MGQPSTRPSRPLLPFLRAQLLTAAAFGAVLLPAWAGQPPGADPAPEPAMQRAVQLYLDYGCGGCHTLSVAGTRGPFAPTHDGMGDIARLRLTDPRYQGEATSPEEYLLESLVEPERYRPPEFAFSRFLMPNYAHLDPADLEALVELLMAQRSEP